MAGTFRNEAFSFFTHLAGALVALVGLVFLVQRAETTRAAIAFAVYGTTLVAMFTSSTLHHIAHKDAGVMRRLDMSAIYLFIAGSYTPVCMLSFPAKWGVPVLGIVWLIAITGVLLLIFAPSTPRRVTAGIYLGLGWMSLIGIVPLVQNVAPAGLAYLVAGGVVYSVGAIVYARKSPDPWPKYVGYHGLWHVFVLVAAGLHFVLMANYVPTA